MDSGQDFDAIVIGSGISGGWAAKELCEKGLKTLVIERGRNIEHNKDYPTATLDPWQLPDRNSLSRQLREDNPIASRCYAFSQATAHFFVKDKEHPYEQVKPFDWIRGYQLGGKSLIWGRWTQRWSNLDFEANARDGVGIDWPIRYEDIASWYSYVERFTGISGNRDGIPHLPDGEFLPPMEMNAVEKLLQQKVAEHYHDRQVIISRTANLSRGLTDRGPCQYRDLCSRGCPFAGYFSSITATLPAARATGNLTLLTDAVAHSLIFDRQKQRVSGIRVVDAHSKSMKEYRSKVVFVNAGTLNSTLLLLNSTSPDYPAGLGNTNDVLGRYLMDHNYRGHFAARHEGLQDSYYYGRRPTGIYIPRFRNLGHRKEQEFTRGYAIAAGGSRNTGASSDSIGSDLKSALSVAGDWNLWMNSMGECLPYADNRVTRDPSLTDAWGIPFLKIDCSYKQNEEAMLKDSLIQGQEMLEKAGFTDINAWDSGQAPGQGIHEMGTARMGRDPRTSMLNSHNQLWAAKNVFVTDGACMVSTACQNPSLTYMALTARAVDFAVTELKKRNL